MPLRKRTYTSDLLTNQQGEVLKVGFLRKKGHVRRNWLDRWFVLTTEGVYYYKKRDVSQTGLDTPKSNNCTKEHEFAFYFFRPRVYEPHPAPNKRTLYLTDHLSRASERVSGR